MSGSKCVPDFQDARLIKITQPGKEQKRDFNLTNGTLVVYTDIRLSSTYIRLSHSPCLRLLRSNILRDIFAVGITTQRATDCDHLRIHTL